MKKKVKFLIVLLTLLSSCVYSKDRRTSDIGKITSKIESVVIKIDSLQGIPAAMAITDNHLVMFMWKGSRPFAVFDMPHFETLKMMGQIGRGPGETNGIDFKSVTYSDNCFSYYDSRGLRTGRFVDDKIVLTGENNQDNIVKNGMIKLESGYVTLNSTGGKEEYVLYDKDFKSKKFFGQYPNWDKSGTMHPLFAYVKNIVASPDGKFFFAFYGHFPMVRVYDSNGKMLKEINHGYLSSSSGVDEVFYNAKPIVFENGIVSLSLNGKAAYPELQIMDWKGNLIWRYLLDSHADLFAIDRNTGDLYMYSFSSPGELRKANIADRVTKIN